MKAYELLFFMNPTTSKDTREAVMQRIQSTIVDNGGEIDNIEDWGTRKLAFEVEKLTEGDYTLIDFHTDPTQIEELNRVLRITDTVIRHMVVARTDRD